MIEKIQAFFKEIAAGEIEIYNEFSLQHELGIYLRTKLEDKKIRFEKNVSCFGWEKENFEKREIDISIIDKDGNLESIIELKYPRSGQVPEQMYGFCKDVAFAEELNRSGFRDAYAIILVDDDAFYAEKRRNDGIYAYFRSGNELGGVVEKPTGKDPKPTIKISGRYKVEWQSISGKLKYALIQVG